MSANVPHQQLYLPLGFLLQLLVLATCSPNPGRRVLTLTLNFFTSVAPFSPFISVSVLSVCLSCSTLYKPTLETR